MIRKVVASWLEDKGFSSTEYVNGFIICKMGDYEVYVSDDSVEIYVSPDVVRHSYSARFHCGDPDLFVKLERELL